MFRQLRFVAALAVMTASCATIEKAFAPAANPWPIHKESRVRRDGRLLRVYGASLKSRSEAEQDARRSLESWMWGLALGDDIPERRDMIDRVINAPAAKPVPSPVPEKSGFTSIIELDLPTLQKALGTHYE
ncbi:MAG: hypothetical protein COV48_11070 [Elusimicrobia bacterium CG11_big_fil_rev_8_21_14_0_20_64_6]|nr:MAG: hypothetical protein COV48_11070 [Elusimicrobia bacterium CG11_big_fil_rev_8_21_14_0_20_64_6]